MDVTTTNRRRHPRLFRNVRFLFYFLGQTREVYTVDISYAGAFIQTDVFPPLGSFIILEHYHLKKRDITLGLVGKIQRIQTPFQNAPSVRGVGVEWVRSYCNQGFMPLKQFFERDLGSQPFDWDTHLLYERYSRKLVFDFNAETLSPSPDELEAMFGTRRGTGAKERAQETAQVRADKTPPYGMKAVKRGPATIGADSKLRSSGESQLKARHGSTPHEIAPVLMNAEELEGADATTPHAGSPAPASGEAKKVRVFSVDASGEPTSESVVVVEGAGPGSDAEPVTESLEARDAEHEASLAELKADLHETEIKIVFGSGNRMFYGVVRALHEKALYVETSSDRVVRPEAKIQVRLPLSTKNYRYMVIIYGRVEAVVEREGGGVAFRMRIESIDEFQNPGGFRYFVEGLTTE